MESFTRIEDQVRLLELKKRVKRVAREVARKMARKIVKEIFERDVTTDIPNGVFDSASFVVTIARKEAEKYAKKETVYQANKCFYIDDCSSSEDEACDVDGVDSQSVDLVLASLVAKQVAFQTTKEMLKNWR